MSSIMQTRYGEDVYSIGRFVLDRATVLSLSRSDLVRRLGYQNLGKGHKAVSDLLLTGVVAAYIAKHLAAALEVEQTVVDEAVAATNAQRAAEARAQRLAEGSAHQEASQPHEAAVVIGDNELVIDSFMVNNGMYRWQTYNSFVDADLTETDQVEKTLGADFLSYLLRYFSGWKLLQRVEEHPARYPGGGYYKVVRYLLSFETDGDTETAARHLSKYGYGSPPRGWTREVPLDRMDGRP